MTLTGSPSPQSSPATGTDASCHSESMPLTDGGVSNATSGARFQMPVARIINAVKVQTTIVSMKGSRPATMPSRTGSSVLAAACAIGDDP